MEVGHRAPQGAAEPGEVAGLEGVRYLAHGAVGWAEVQDVDSGGHCHGVVWGMQRAPEGDVVADGWAIQRVLATGEADIQRAVSG